MKTINYSYIMMGITILIMLVAIIVFANGNDIDKIRENNLDLYSKQLNGVQIDIERREEQIEYLSGQIQDLRVIEDGLITCLKLNSQPGLATDCLIFKPTEGKN